MSTAFDNPLCHPRHSRARPRFTFIPGRLAALLDYGTTHLGGRMGRRKRFLFGMLVLLLPMMLGGCRHEQVASALPVDDNAPIKTDRASYTLRVEGPYAFFKPTATYVNRTNVQVYIEVCGTDQPFFGLEKLVGGRWESVELAVGYGCTSELIHHEVPPGGRFVQSFGSVFLDATDSLEGMYRMVWIGVKATPDQYDVPLPKPQRVSNAFELKVP